MRSLSRRTLLVAGGAMPFTLMPVIASAARFDATPAQTEGPFYPDRLPSDVDNDLIRIAGQVRQAGGEPLRLDGQVLDPDGRPVAGSRIEIWQADANGRYIASGDRFGATARDPAFQGYGTTQSDANGAYWFRTIRPVPYTGRTPHIHFRIHHPNGRALTTQMYVAGEPLNARDGLYNSLNRPAQERVTVALTPDGQGGWTGRFRIVLPWPAAAG